MVKHAVIVGIENYKNNINQVFYASNDAIAFKDAMLSNGCKIENIHLLLNEDATSTSILATLQAITYKFEQNDEVIFCFAGHGEIYSGQQYLITYDTHYNNIPKTAISLDQLFSLMRDFEKVIFFLDSCHSGMPIKTLQRGEEINLEDPFDVIKSLEYQVAFASCKNGEKSYGSDTLKHGTWTYHVVQALTGNAPQSIYGPQGQLTCSALQGYLIESVPTFVKAEQGEDKSQTPWFFGGLTREFLIRNSPTTLPQELSKTTLTKLNLMDVIKIEHFRFIQKDSVRNLSGFKKASHRVPTYYNDSSRDFVIKIAEVDIENAIQKLLSQLQDLELYKDSEINVEITAREGFGVIDCNEEFYIQVIFEQDENNLSNFIITNEIAIHSNKEKYFEMILPNLSLKIFDQITYRIPSKINIRNAILLLESENTTQDNILYDYTPGSNTIKIRLSNMPGDLILKDNSNSLEFHSYKSNVNEVYDEFKSFLESIQNPKIQALVMGIK